MLKDRGRIHTTGVADRVAALITAPQGGHRGAAVLAGDHHGGVLALTLGLLGGHIDWLWCAIRTTTALIGCFLVLEGGELRALGHTVVEGGTAATALRTSCAVTPATAWARSGGGLVGSNVGRSVGLTTTGLR